MNILNIDKKVSPKSFDCVLLLDVIEHLEKLEGIKLIKKIQEIGEKKIIIFTPNGYVPQHHYHNNIYQTHKSSWDIKIFKKMNFQIYGINGLKFILGERKTIKYRPIPLWWCISLILNLFVKFFPQFAYQLLCIKELQVMK